MARPRTYKTQGVVLKRMSLGEADRIVTIYTPDLGKVRAVAKGVRRVKSKLAGHLEPLTHVHVAMAQGKSLDTITEAETIRSFRDLREDLQRVSRALYVAELVDGFTADRSPNAAEFRLLLSALGWLQDADGATKPLRYFEAQLLAITGFGPELHQCVECHAGLPPRDHSFSSARGGILCPECRVESQEPLLSVTLNAIKVLRYLQREPYGRVQELRVPPALLSQVERLLGTYVRHVLERDLKSVEFMDLVNQR